MVLLTQQDFSFNPTSFSSNIKVRDEINAIMYYILLAFMVNWSPKMENHKDDSENGYSLVFPPPPPP